MITPTINLHAVQIIIKVNGEERLSVSKKFNDENSEKIVEAFKQIAAIGEKYDTAKY